MRGFIVNETYRVERGKAYVYLFGRLENGKSFCTRSYYRPYFCIREEDVETAKGLPATIRYEVERTGWTTMSGERVVRLVYDIPKDTIPLRRLFEQHGIQCFEADIRFTQRFLLDKDIRRAVEIDGSYAEGEYVDRFYDEPSLEDTEWYPDLKVLSFDIETSPKADRLYSISLVTDDRKEVLIVSDKKLDRARSFPGEKSLLEAFRAAVMEIDPDIVTGWNSIDFDLAVLRDKFREHRIPFRFGRAEWDCSLRLESSFLRESAADCPGRQVLDGIQMLKLNFIGLDNYKLSTAAKEILGDGKLIGDENKGEEIVDAYRNDQQKLVDYNLKDSQLVLDILRETNAVDIMLHRALLTGMSLDRVRGSIASFDSLYLRELRKRGRVAPSVAGAAREERISGGFVMESRPGLYDNIVVLDFKSLYPSIMRTFNIDPLSFALAENAERTIEAPNGARFDAEEGILPELLQRLWDARDEAKQSNDGRKSFAIKILMNSFFGVLASPACRFFSLDVGNAITGFGRHFIKLTAERVREAGKDVIYGDTDSVFLDVGTETHDAAAETGERIAEDINAFYREHIGKEYGRDCYLELELDKVFTCFLMPRIRGGETGAKKRYAGLVRTDGKDRLVVTGMEIVRRDWTALAKEFQERLLRLVFAKENPDRFVRQFVGDLKDGKMDSLLVYQKAVRKQLEDYVKTTPPHVKAARLQIEHDIPLESNIVEYIQTMEGPYPVALMRRPGGPSIDYDHYVEKQLRPIADAILSFYDMTFSDILRGSKQTTLGGF